MLSPLVPVVSATLVTLVPAATCVFAALTWPKFAASVLAVPAKTLVIALLFRLAPPFRLDAPVTVREPAVIAPVEVTVVNVGVAEVPIVTLFPARVMLTLLPLRKVTVSFEPTAVAVSVFARNLNV